MAPFRNHTPTFRGMCKKPQKMARFKLMMRWWPDSRAYLPEEIWFQLREQLRPQPDTVKKPHVISTPICAGHVTKNCNSIQLPHLTSWIPGIIPTRTSPSSPTLTWPTGNPASMKLLGVWMLTPRYWRLVGAYHVETVLSAIIVMEFARTMPSSNSVRENALPLILITARDAEFAFRSALAAPLIWWKKQAEWTRELAWLTLHQKSNYEIGELPWKRKYSILHLS